MKNIKSAEILSVGTELLLGDIANTDAAFISKRLAALGINVYRHTVVGDNDSRLRTALAESLSRADLVITTGGLGPTYDDMTKETVCSYFGCTMHRDDESYERMKHFFDGIGAVMTENNIKQADMPDGAVVLKNDNGTAPGLAIEDKNGKTVMMFPGPPSELCPMFLNYAEPYIMKRRASDVVIFSRNIHLIGIGESAVEDILRPIMLAAENPTLAPYCGDGEVRLRVTARAESEDDCRVMCDKIISEIKVSPVGKFIYAIDTPSTEAAVIELLRKSKLTLATAESCTGGLIGKRLTDIPGASEVYLGGVISYANSVKTGVLGVKKSTLDSVGAVAEQTAFEMAQGVCKLTGADIGISTTGIAGPTGGSEKKPVGLVYLGISTPDGTKVEQLGLGSVGRSRDKIRTMAASRAFNAVIKYVKSKQ